MDVKVHRRRAKAIAAALICIIVADGVLLTQFSQHPEHTVADYDLVDAPKSYRFTATEPYLSIAVASSYRASRPLEYTLTRAGTGEAVAEGILHEGGEAPPTTTWQDLPSSGAYVLQVSPEGGQPLGSGRYVVTVKVHGVGPGTTEFIMAFWLVVLPVISVTGFYLFFWYRKYPLYLVPLILWFACLLLTSVISRIHGAFLG